MTYVPAQKFTHIFFHQVPYALALVYVNLPLAVLEVLRASSQQQQSQAQVPPPVSSRTRSPAAVGAIPRPSSGSLSGLSGQSSSG